MAFEYDSSEFPQQVSSDQASEDRSEIAFSNGASFPTHGNEHVRHPENQFFRNEALNLSVADIERRPLRTYAEETTLPQRLRPQQAKHPQYADYGERLRTFARWSRSNPGPNCLCNAGFFFTSMFQKLIKHPKLINYTLVQSKDVFTKFFIHYWLKVNKLFKCFHETILFDKLKIQAN